MDGGAGGRAAVGEEERAGDAADAGLVGGVLEPGIGPLRAFRGCAGGDVGLVAVVEVPEPGAPDLAVGEVVGGESLEVGAVDHIELDGIAGLRLAVDLEKWLAIVTAVILVYWTYHEFLL